MRMLTVFILLFISSEILAQSCEKVLFTGRVVDTLRPQSFYNLMIVNRTTGRGVFGQPNGTFSVYVEDGDSVSISVKDYPIQHFLVKADSNCQFRKRIYIEMKAQEVQEVIVKPLKTLEQIKEEREALAMRETRMVTGIDMMQSPITALYQAFSKVERNKRWIAEQQYKDNQRQIVKELLRLYVAYDVIELTEKEFDSFIEFLNINEDFLKTATEIELITFIKDKYEHFNIVNKIGTEVSPEWRKLLATNYNGAVRGMLNTFVTNKVIELPEKEFDRFAAYLNLNREVLMRITDVELISYVRDRYKTYLDFYKIDVRLLASNYNITEEDNEDWKWILKHKKDKKEATIALLNLYNERKVIQLNRDEYEKFITFMNLKESFINSATNEQLVNFVRTKFYEYLDFYRK